MKQYYISKADGSQEGPYPENIIQACIAQGVYPPDTLVWREGMNEWIPVTEAFPPSTSEQMGVQKKRRIKHGKMRNIAIQIKKAPKSTFIKFTLAACVITLGIAGYTMRESISSLHEDQSLKQEKKSAKRADKKRPDRETMRDSISSLYENQPLKQEKKSVKRADKKRPDRETMLKALFPDRTPERIKEIEGQLGKSATGRSNESRLLDEVKLLKVCSTSEQIALREANTKAFLYIGANPDTRDIEGNAPLHYATRPNGYDVVRLLVSAGADPNIQNNEGYTPLLIASQINMAGLVKLLIEAGADANIKNNKGVSPLMACMDRKAKISFDAPRLTEDMAAELQEDIAAQLLSADADFSDINLNEGNNGTFLLNAALIGRRADIAKQIIDAGVNVNIGNEKTLSIPLHEAAANGVDVGFLIEAGADVTRCNREGTALHMAAGADNAKNIKLLINAGSDINKKNHEGYTALHIAAKHEKIKNIEVLLKAGADVNTKDNENLTPLETALLDTLETTENNITSSPDNIKKHLKTIELLMAAPGTDVANILFKAMQLEARFNHERKGAKAEAAKLLKDEVIPLIMATPGFHINQTNEDGETILMQAVRIGNDDVVEKLLTIPGINVNIKNNEGKSAIDIAKRRNRRFVKRMLDASK